MQKTNLRLQSLNSEKFYSLTNEQQLTVRGGTETPGGSQKNGPTRYVGVYPNQVRETPIRSWTSDSIDANGVKCYTGLEECVSVQSFF